MENFLPERQREEAGRAAAEEDGSRLEAIVNGLKFSEERVDVTLHQRGVTGFGIEGAIFAFARAERDVDVKAPYRLAHTAD